MTKLRKIPLAVEPNQKIIDSLREVLRDAKLGQVHAVGIAVARLSDDPDADLGRTTETIMAHTPGWQHSLCTAVNGLAFRLNYERHTSGFDLPPGVLSDEDE